MLLFFPSGYPLFQTDLALRLIQRYSVTLGSQVAIVTRDRILRNVAADIGIPCFISAPQAEKSLWRIRSKQNLVRIPRGAEEIKEQKDSLPAKKLSNLPSNFQKIFTSLLLFSLLVTLALFFIPSAEIILFPVTETQEITYKVSAGSDYISVDISGKLPATKLSQGVTAESTKNSSGTIYLPVSKAAGTVEVINASSQDIFLPAGSRLISDTEPQMPYTLVGEVNLKANFSVPVSIRIEATDPGEDWNVPNGIKFFIEGYEDLIQVQNSIAISGGKDQSLPSPGEADYLYLQNRLTKKLLESCKEELENQVKTDQALIPESIQLSEESTMVESPPVGQPSDSATLSITSECSALVISKDDEIGLAKRILDQNLLSGKVTLTHDISITPMGGVKDGGVDRFSWMVTAKRSITQKWNSEELINSLLGKRLSDAREILSVGLPQNSPAIIKINPQWWKFMPLLPTRVHFEVNPE